MLLRLKMYHWIKNSLLRIFTCKNNCARWRNVHYSEIAKRLNPVLVDEIKVTRNDVGTIILPHLGHWLRRLLNMTSQSHNILSRCIVGAHPKLHTPTLLTQSTGPHHSPPLLCRLPTHGAHKELQPSIPIDKPEEKPIHSHFHWRLLGRLFWRS